MTDVQDRSLSSRCGTSARRDLGNSLRAVGTILAWAVCFAGVSQLIKREVIPEGPLRWVVAALPTVAGVFVLWAYARFLRQADELTRLIQLEALAIAFGGAFFAAAGYRVFESAGAPDIDLAGAIVVWAVLYAIASARGWRRYR